LTWRVELKREGSKCKEKGGLHIASRKGGKPGCLGKEFSKEGEKGGDCCKRAKDIFKSREREGKNSKIHSNPGCIKRNRLRKRRKGIVNLPRLWGGGKERGIPGKWGGRDVEVYPGFVWVLCHYRFFQYEKGKCREKGKKTHPTLGEGGNTGELVWRSFSLLDFNFCRVKNPKEKKKKSNTHGKARKIRGVAQGGIRL